MAFNANLPDMYSSGVGVASNAYYDTSANPLITPQGQYIYPKVAPAAVIQENPSMYEAAVRDSRSTAIENSYLSQMFAREQMDFQAASQLASMEFNSAEAAKNRNWQEYMSNTAHQREVRDLLAAGLNPILSAMGGNGATTGSGATASSSAMSGASGSVDTSGNQAVASLVGAALQAENNYEMNKVNAITSLAIAEQQRKNNLDMQDKTLEMQRKQLENALEIARMSSESSKYQADMSKTVAEIYTASQLATAQISAGAILGSAGINAQSALGVAGMYTEAQKYGVDAETGYKYWHDLYTAQNPGDFVRVLYRMGLSSIADMMQRLTPSQQKGVMDAMTRGLG